MKDRIFNNNAIQFKTKQSEKGKIYEMQVDNLCSIINPHESFTIKKSTDHFEVYSYSVDNPEILTKIQTTNEKENLCLKNNFSKNMKSKEIIVNTNSQSVFQQKEIFSPFNQFSSLLNLFEKLNNLNMEQSDNNQVLLNYPHYECLFSLSFLSNYKSLQNPEINAQEQSIPVLQFPINSNICRTNFIEEILKSFDDLQANEIENILCNINNLINKAIDDNNSMLKNILPDFQKELDNYVKISRKINEGFPITIDLIQQFFPEMNSNDVYAKEILLQKLVKENNFTNFYDNTDLNHHLFDSECLKKYFRNINIIAKKDFLGYSFIILLVNSAFNLYLSQIKLILRVCLLYCIAFELNSFDPLKKIILIFFSQLCSLSRSIANQYYEISRSILVNIDIIGKNYSFISNNFYFFNKLAELALEKYENYLSESLKSNFENLLSINYTKLNKEDNSEIFSTKNSKMCKFYLNMISFLKLDLFLDKNEYSILRKYEISEIRNFIEKNLESKLVTNNLELGKKPIFSINKVEFKKLKLADAISKVKEIHKNRQNINELDLNFNYKNSCNQEEIYLDLSKDSYNSRKILQVAHFRNGFSGSMNYRSHLLLICGLYAFLYSKMIKVPDFLKYFIHAKNEKLKSEFKKIVLIGKNFKQILKDINNLLGFFLNSIDKNLDDLLTKYQSEIIKKLNKIIKEENFSSKNLNKNSRLNFPNPIFKMLNKYQLDIKKYPENEICLTKKFIEEIKKLMIISNIKDNLKNNKSTNRIYMKLLNLYPFSRSESLVTVLNLAIKNKIFKISKCQNFLDLNSK